MKETYVDISNRVGIPKEPKSIDQVVEENSVNLAMEAKDLKRQIKEIEDLNHPSMANLLGRVFAPGQHPKGS